MGQRVKVSFRVFSVVDFCMGLHAHTYTHLCGGMLVEEAKAAPGEQNRKIPNLWPPRPSNKTSMLFDLGLEPLFLCSMTPKGRRVPL